jgi:hypothetical protein
VARRERLTQLTTRSAAGPPSEDRSTALGPSGRPSLLARSLPLAGLLGLALLGCGDGKRSGSESTGDPQGAAAATEVDEGSILPAERRQEIWDLEHLAFELEQRWAPAWLAPLAAADAAPLAAMLPGTPRLIPLDGHPTTFETPSLRESSWYASAESDASPTLVDAAAWTSRWQSRFARFAAVPTVSTEVVSIAPLPTEPGSSAADSPTHVALLRWVLAGDSTDGGPLRLEGRDELTLRIGDPLKVDREPIVIGWRETERVEASTGTRWFEEITEQVKLDVTGTDDNWVNPPDMLTLFKFQMGIEDFDGDGRPDIAVGGIGEPPLLLRRQPNAVFRTVAWEREIYFATPLSLLTCAWFDLDRDRDPDLIFADRLFRNDRGVFTDVSTESRLRIEPFCMGVVPGDYDLDGDIDLYLVYQRAVQQVGGSAASWIDAPGQGRANALWRNEGNGTFVDVTAEAKCGGGARMSNAAVWFHLDDDLYPDLYVANEFSQDVVLRNAGDGTFEDVTRSMGGDDFAMSTGIASGDLDGDGRVDLYVSGLTNRAGRRILSRLQEGDHPAPILERLAVTVRGGRAWVDSDAGWLRGSLPESAAHAGWAFGPAIADLDNDGRNDLLVAAGFNSRDGSGQDGASNFWQSMVTSPERRSIGIAAKGTLDSELGESWSERPSMILAEGRNLASHEPNRVLLGSGDLGFRDLAGLTGLDLDSDSRTIIPVDLDRDGAIDIVVGSVGGGVLRAFANRLPKRHWIGIQLAGSKSNAYGIGAKVSVEANGQRQVKHLFRTVGFLGQQPAELHFGLGDATRIDRLEIAWPSGETTIATDVEVDRWTRWFEDGRDTETLEPPMLAPRDGAE